MKFSYNTKLILFICLIVLTILLRILPEFQEIGSDSFEIHSQVNSISEYGKAKWITSPLSFFGLVPLSYTSAVQFFLSGMHQITNIDTRWIVLLYGIIMGILSIFFIYLFAGEIINDDLYKFLASFGFSISGALLDFTTWSLTTRGFVLVLGPLLLFSLLKIHNSNNKKTYILLTFILSVLLFASHHLFYFLLPSYIAIIVIGFRFKLNSFFRHKIDTLLIFVLIIASFSVPFVLKKFIEESRYYPFYIDLLRYGGIFFLFSIGGFVYLSFKSNKTFGEWFILINAIFLIAFVYNQTYFKHFASIFIVILASIAIVNTINVSKKQLISVILFIILISSISFSGYFQFLIQYSEYRSMPESNYISAKWLKAYGNGSGISNDLLLGIRMNSISETTHIVTNSMIVNTANSFLILNLSDPSVFSYYPISSEAFWFDVGKYGDAYGEKTWYDFNMLKINPMDFNILYAIEHNINPGYIIWHHTNPPRSKIFEYTHENSNIIYSINNINIYLI